MPSKNRVNFANDNGPLSESDREALGIALSLDDAKTLKAALRDKIDAIRQRALAARKSALSPQHDRSSRRMAPLTLVLARDAASL